MFTSGSCKHETETYIAAEDEELWRCGQHDENSNYILNLGEAGGTE